MATGNEEQRSCVKCPEPGIFHGLDAKKAVYCKPCFITMVKHKFSSTIGKKRIFKGDAAKETLVVYEGDLSSAFMLWLIQQGTALDTHKKLQLLPIILVLLTQSDEEEIQDYVSRIADIRDVLHTDWYFVHVSSLLDAQFQPSTSAPALNKLSEWNQLCASFKTNTARVEFERLSRTAICLRAAKSLDIHKVMLADDADALSKDSLNALCLGRGSSLGDIAGVIDKRHPDVTIIRPLRDVSRLEISTVNSMHDNEHLILAKSKNPPPKRAIQPLSECLIDDLQTSGFKSTITTILSVASKVKALHPGDQKCSLCFTLYSLEDDDASNLGCCRACNSILGESTQLSALERLCRSIMISRQVLKRGFATAAARSPIVATAEEKVSKLQNGLTVASVDMGGPVSNLVLAYRAGARYESADEVGLVHHLRNLIGTDSANFLGVKMIWQAGSIGAQLSSAATNDLLLVQMSVIRDNADVALSLLGELSQPACKAWDVEDNIGSLSYDRTNRTPYEKLLEHIHKAGYRNGPLGNRVTAKNHCIGKVSFRQLADFAGARLRTGEAALVGVNVGHENLLRYATEQLRLPEGTGKAAVASPYLGGDVRHEAAGSFSHVAIFGEGSGLTDAKNVAVQTVLAALIGNGPSTKYSNGLGHGVVAQAVQKAANGTPVGVSSINISHSDSGLTGVYLVAEGSRVAPLVSAATGALKSIAGSVDEQALAIAKATAKTDVLSRADIGATLAVNQATQLLASGNAVSPAEFAKLVEGVTAADIKKAAEQVAKNLSVAAHGKVNQVPYLDQL